MTATADKDWTKDFGLNNRHPPSLFTSKDQVAPATPQAHLLGRAFDTLKVDGILCIDHTPLAYFKLVRQITPETVAELHRQFWNHSGATLLVLISDDRVHIYSGMIRPEPYTPATGKEPSLVDSLDRVTESLREFIVAVESGEFFHRYQRSFDPKQRVDRHLLDNLRLTRQQLDTATRKKIPSPILDALLCRLVFTCYLFDREVIGEKYLSDLGIRNARDLRDVLAIPSPSKAKTALYQLFEKLKEDFNGDLFSNDLAAERDLIDDPHITTLNRFFQGMHVASGQGALFRLYDFKYIPIETISAIYERFLQTADEKKGAFYTPRFLAEVVLDTALDGARTLIGKRFFDPACGSGIFLVGIFNRIAEEWNHANPTARNIRRATELMRLLRESLFGVDVSLTACRITAFSLYLAYLDQLSPPDIQALQAKGRALPRLVAAKDDESDALEQGIIHEADFFSSNDHFPKTVSLIIGNPPWGSIALKNTPAGQWCSDNARPLPDKQIAAAFIWKATEHVAANGRVCFVLPHGVLFNHSTTALPFQKTWIRTHAIDRVLNLADFQRFLFEKAGHPALVVRYRKPAPSSAAHSIEYWAPKADWTVTKAEVISIAPQDRTVITVGQLLKDLDGPDAPQLWKQRFWATPRDWRLLDRLLSFPRLRDVVRGPKDDPATKRWLMGVGFQPETEGDDPEKSERLRLPSKLFVAASNRRIDLFLLTRDCRHLSSNSVVVRSGSNKNIIPFQAPHVLVAKGFSRVAFADFDVSFQDALRGIHGPQEDRSLLVFLSAYLRSSVARYFLFHTSANWGVSRQVVDVEEILRLPFPLPEQQSDFKRSRQIVAEVTKIVDNASRRADADLADRAGIVRAASDKVELLIEEYFDILPAEKALVEDTNRVIIESTRPTRARLQVPTLTPATPVQQRSYSDRVCKMLNGWAKRGQFIVHGQTHGSASLGVGIAVFEKVERAQAAVPPLDNNSNNDLIRLLDGVRKAIPRKHATLDVVRGVTVFDGNRLYVVKPIGQRFWTQTAAMNDADDIAATILMRTPEEDA